MLDLVTVGHFVIDLIISPRGTNPVVTLGGPPTFVSVAASTLGAKAGVVSKVGRDFLKYVDWLCHNNIDLSLVKVFEKASTTRYELTYNGDERELQLKDLAPSIVVDDLPSSLRAHAIHVSPVANELSTSILGTLRDKTPLLSIDLQGFLREFDESGFVNLKGLGDMNFLQQCDVFKSSIEEIKAVTRNRKLRDSVEKIRECGVKTVLVTMGREGTLAYVGEEFYHVPACKPAKLIDPTGAGDAFMGGFLAELIRKREPLWCCCVGSAAASFVLEDFGFRRLPEGYEIYERATKIYEKGIKPVANDVAA